jgi:hypothetical protein
MTDRELLMTDLKIATFSSIIGWAQTMKPPLQKGAQPRSLRIDTNLLSGTGKELIREIRGKESFFSRLTEVSILRSMNFHSAFLDGAVGRIQSHSGASA